MEAEGKAQMPNVCAGTACSAILLLGAMSGGCAVERRPLVVVDPDYSYLRDGGTVVSAALARSDADAVELADLDALLPIELTEPSLLRPARTLVQVAPAPLRP